MGKFEKLGIVRVEKLTIEKIKNHIAIHKIKTLNEKTEPRYNKIYQFAEYAINKILKEEEEKEVAIC